MYVVSLVGKTSIFNLVAPLYSICFIPKHRPFCLLFPSCIEWISRRSHQHREAHFSFKSRVRDSALCGIIAVTIRQYQLCTSALIVRNHLCSVCATVWFRLSVCFRLETSFLIRSELRNSKIRLIMHIACNCNGKLPTLTSSGNSALSFN